MLANPGGNPKLGVATVENKSKTVALTNKGRGGGRGGGEEEEKPEETELNRGRGHWQKAKEQFIKETGFNYGLI